LVCAGDVGSLDVAKFRRFNVSPLGTVMGTKDRDWRSGLQEVQKNLSTKLEHEKSVSLTFVNFGMKAEKILRNGKRYLISKIVISRITC